jgi:hypothetical protein
LEHDARTCNAATALARLKRPPRCQKSFFITHALGAAALGDHVQDLALMLAKYPLV